MKKALKDAETKEQKTDSSITKGENILQKHLKKADAKVNSVEEKIKKATKEHLIKMKKIE